MHLVAVCFLACVRLCLFSEAFDICVRSEGLKVCNGVKVHYVTLCAVDDQKEIVDWSIQQLSMLELEMLLVPC